MAVEVPADVAADGGGGAAGAGAGAAFGALLRAHRRAAGLSQDALAERAGLSARAVSDLERGVTRAPRPDTLRLLAGALALPPGTQATLAAAAWPAPAAAAAAGRGTTWRPR